ncbi:cytochrome b [Pseudoroseicyclus tamaricis]|uniref:Cytochrome b n=1 Tax=Pseudoroseicyclus tamaricis TaxID=2705421 RepID=A0A6B2K0L8_9RHOB|nr:cytochrome b/b6 domain-containing protein [Pseudoroseicyclus tamaricis]NDV01984.1 cytochrome b [Pseudoroseicyclus tamaricis]
MPRSRDKYSSGQILLHWLTLAVLIVSWVSHDAVEAAFEQVAATGPFTAQGLVHRIAGVAVLALTLVRVGLRMRHGAPPEPKMPGWMLLVAQASHFALYALLLMIPILGLIAWVGAIESAAELHETLFWMLAITVAVHIGAALYHQFIRHDGLLRRMMPAPRAR